MITIEEVKAKTPERFWSKIKFAGPDECWEWQAGVRTRYGRFRAKTSGKKSRVDAHKFVFDAVNGTHTVYRIHGRKNVVAHECDNPKCCNPNHLFKTTPKGNIRDMFKKGRSKKSNRMFSNEQAMEIKERLKNGESISKIAAHFNAWDPNILAIKQNKTYKNVSHLGR